MNREVIGKRKQRDRPFGGGRPYSLEQINSEACAWSITGEQHLVTLHVHPSAGTISRDVLAAVQFRLAERFSIEHVTVRVEEDACIDTHAHDAKGAGATDCH